MTFLLPIVPLLMLSSKQLCLETFIRKEDRGRCLCLHLGHELLIEKRKVVFFLFFFIFLTVVVKLIDLLVIEDRIVNRWPAPSFVIYTE